MQFEHKQLLLCMTYAIKLYNFIALFLVHISKTAVCKLGKISLNYSGGTSNLSLHIMLVSFIQGQVLKSDTKNNLADLGNEPINQNQSIH